jgi:hypothetical protein
LSKEQKPWISKAFVQREAVPPLPRRPTIRLSRDVGQRLDDAVDRVLDQ